MVVMHMPAQYAYYRTVTAHDHDAAATSTGWLTSQLAGSRLTAAPVSSGCVVQTCGIETASTTNYQCNCFTAGKTGKQHGEK